MDAAAAKQQSTATPNNDIQPPQQHHPRRRLTAALQGCDGQQHQQQSVSVVVSYTSFLCGLAAGMCQAGVFNGYDRAMYKSLTENRHFLHPANWRNMHVGFWQSISSKALSGGLYFPTEHFFLQYLEATTTSSSSSSKQFLAGMLAGATNAVLLNPLTTVKYKTWKRNANIGLLHETVRMWKHGNWRVFFRGFVATIATISIYILLLLLLLLPVFLLSVLLLSTHHENTPVLISISQQSYTPISRVGDMSLCWLINSNKSVYTSQDLGHDSLKPPVSGGLAAITHLIGVS